MKARLTSFVLALALVFSFAFAGDAHAQDVGQVGGARGLVAAVVQLNNVLNQNDIRVIDSSFNNLTALNNVLNNSPILSNNDIDVNVLSIEDALNDLTIRDVLQNFLNNNDVDIDVEDIVAIVVLPLGGILVLV